MKYVYQVTEEHAIGSLYFSSWLKAFKYCQNSGAYNRGYDDDYISQMKSENGRVIMEIIWKKWR